MSNDNSKFQNFANAYDTNPLNDATRESLSRMEVLQQSAKDAVSFLHALLPPKVSAQAIFDAKLKNKALFTVPNKAMRSQQEKERSEKSGGVGEDLVINKRAVQSTTTTMAKPQRHDGGMVDDDGNDESGEIEIDEEGNIKIRQSAEKDGASSKKKKAGRKHQEEDSELRTKKNKTTQLDQKVTTALSDMKKYKMSAKEKKLFNLHHKDKHVTTYQDLLPAYEIWRCYMLEVVGYNQRNVQVVQEHLLRADLHGARCMIHKATNPDLVTRSGIIMKETKYSLVLMTEKKNKMITVPKAGTVFQFNLDFLYPKKQMSPYFLLYGDQLLIRPFERPTRKFKVVSTIELWGNMEHIFFGDTWHHLFVHPILIW